MLDLKRYGYIRAAAAVPKVTVANPEKNAAEAYSIIKEAAEKDNVKVIVFPELSITGYTCADLFHQNALLGSAETVLKDLIEKTKNFDCIVAAGVPVEADNQLFNCAAVFSCGKILGLVPKTFLPNYNEYYEKRWFASSATRISDTVRFCGQEVPFGENLLFQDSSSSLCIGAEICEDLWMPIPQSSNHALHGANLIINLSASNEIIGKTEYRKELVRQQSARCFAGYIYTSAGQTESTTDLVFGGHSLIAESGSLLKEMRFAEKSSYIFTDIDIEKMMNDRRKFNSFMGSVENKNYRKIYFSLKDCTVKSLAREMSPKPFVPADKGDKDARCREIFKLQSTGLAQRMGKIGIKKAVIGLSGGLDSTLALLVTVEAMKSLGLPPQNIIGITMPGFGTTGRTYNNAVSLMKELHITVREISIKDACLRHFDAIGHSGQSHDIAYENVQARERTQILFDVANMEGGLVIGTGDLSELALGWCTYNGDHMSMYAVNTSIPKTLVRHLVTWYSETTDNKTAADVLKDVVSTPVSPELLPPDENGEIQQETESIIGPYELHDFFLYHMIRNGFTPSKIFMLAKLAFKNEFDSDTILKWLKSFYRRFFSQQFKRSCLPDGVKVGSVCLSPRGDWRMPSDVTSETWMKELESIDEDKDGFTDTKKPN